MRPHLEKKVDLFRKFAIFVRLLKILRIFENIFIELKIVGGAKRGEPPKISPFFNSGSELVNMQIILLHI